MVKRYSRKSSKKQYKVFKRRTRKNSRKRSKKKNTRKKLRGGAKKEDIITNETQISNLDPNTIIKDIDVGGITNPLGVDEKSESDEMNPSDPDIQMERDMILARKLNLENEVQTPEVKQEIEELENALKIEPIQVEDKIISISPIESLGNKEYYNTTNFSVFEILINISGKLTKICDIRPTDSSKYCEELYYSSETEKENLTKMWLETNFTYLNFFGSYLPFKIFFANKEALGEKSEGFPHKRLLGLIMKYEYEKGVCNKYDGSIDLEYDVSFSETLKKLFEFKVDQRVVAHTSFLFLIKGKPIGAHSTLLISEHFPDPVTGIYKKKLIFFNPDSQNHKTYNKFRFFINRYYMDNFGLPQGESQIPYKWVFSNRISSAYRFSIQEGPTCRLYSYKLWLLLILNPEISAEKLIVYLFSQSSNITKQLIQTAYSSLYFIELFYRYAEEYIKNMRIGGDKYKSYLENKDEPSKAYKKISDYLDINGCPKLSLSGSVPVKSVIEILEKPEKHIIYKKKVR